NIKPCRKSARLHAAHRIHFTLGRTRLTGQLGLRRLNLCESHIGSSADLRTSRFVDHKAVFMLMAIWNADRVNPIDVLSAKLRSPPGNGLVGYVAQRDQSSGHRCINLARYALEAKCGAGKKQSGSFRKNRVFRAHEMLRKWIRT